MKNVDSNRTIAALLAGKLGKKYQGKQVVVIGDEVHIIPKTKIEATKLFKKLDKKAPNQTPAIVYVPRPEAYILICQ